MFIRSLLCSIKFNCKSIAYHLSSQQVGFECDKRKCTDACSQLPHEPRVSSTPISPPYRRAKNSSSRACYRWNLFSVLAGSYDFTPRSVVRLCPFCLPVLTFHLGRYDLVEVFHSLLAEVGRSVPVFG